MDYKKLIERAKELDFSDVEIYESSSRNLSIELFNGKVDKNELSDTTSLSIRAIFDGKMAYINLENLNEDIDYILNILRENALSLTTDEEFEIYGGSKEYPQVDVGEHDFNNYTNLDRIEILKDLEQKLKAADKRIVHVSFCAYQEVEAAVRIINSLGLDVAKQNYYTYVVVQAVAREGEDTQSGYDFEFKHKIKDIDINKLTDIVIEKTVSMLNAKPVKSKTYPVIIENKTMSSLFASYQSIFSGEAAIKKITPLLGKENTKFMSDKVTIVDDPLKEDATFVHPFDDEGVACYKKEVVKDGVFQTFLHNLKTARYFKTKSTGNGFKSGSSITVSGSNIYIEPGDVSNEELIQGIEEGLLITSLEGLHAGVNDISGDFSLKASGFLIENGKKSRPVNLIVIAGNFFKLMNNIEYIGNDLYLSYTGIGAPSIRFKGIAVSGE